MSLAIIEQSYQDTPVFFQSNAFINASSIAAKFNKKPETYLKTKRTKEYVEALKKALFPVALKSATEQNQLVIVTQGGKPESQGTWLHPKLAIDFARWLNPDFAVWCDMQIEKLLHPVRNALIEPELINAHQKRHIQEIVNQIKHHKGIHHQTSYHSLKTEFNVSKYDELKQSQYPSACKFLGAEPRVFEGELLAKELPTVNKEAIRQEYREELKKDDYVIVRRDVIGMRRFVRDNLPSNLLPIVLDVAWDRLKAINFAK